MTQPTTRRPDAPACFALCSPSRNFALTTRSFMSFGLVRFSTQIARPKNAPLIVSVGMVYCSRSSMASRTAAFSSSVIVWRSIWTPEKFISPSSKRCSKLSSAFLSEMRFSGGARRFRMSSRRSNLGAKASSRCLTPFVLEESKPSASFLSMARRKVHSARER